MWMAGICPVNQTLIRFLKLDKVSIGFGCWVGYIMILTFPLI